MTFETFEERAWRSFRSQDTTHREQLLDVALGLAAETGGFVSLAHAACCHGRFVVSSTGAAALGDVLAYLAVACRVLGTSLEEVAIAHHTRLQDRDPDGDEGEDG